MDERRTRGATDRRSSPAHAPRRLPGSGGSRAYGDALFGPEDEVAQLLDGDGRVVAEYTVGGCLGCARDAVGSRQAYLTIQRTQWDAETLNGLRTPQGRFGREADVEADAQALLEAWRPQRDRILARLDEVTAR
ncbi:hypothetical protein [Nitriliruptor alkaliphilus]|uniref:hypothetical protein n=1 Tax=Nitriliruptor alkaliphilus TaxID=427918 RepID=UPI000697AABD|nr:hypothetical protein [Nitriliruptor alkaliphilus]